jgi:hypothetical protein
MIDHDFFLSKFMNKKEEKIIQFTRVDSNYSSGRSRLIFDGESVVHPVFGELYTVTV